MRNLEDVLVNITPWELSFFMREGNFDDVVWEGRVEVVEPFF